MNNELLCPKCGSNKLSANKKGFSGGKAVAGAVLTGGIGLLAGTIGSNKIKITCLSCGHEFKPGQDKKSVINQKRHQAETIKKPGFWIFFGVCMIGIIWMINSCFNIFDSPTDSTQTESINVNSDSNIDISNISYEIISDELSSNSKLDVYVKNPSDVSKLNDYFVDLYNRNGDVQIIINYFDDKEIGSKYFSMISDPKYSDKQLDAIFKHYIAQYNCNPSTGYKAFKLMN